MLQDEAKRADPDGDSALSEIMQLLELRGGVPADGWNGESARLFAIDTAIMMVRRRANRLAEADRQAITARLHEARRLAVAGRDAELGFIQATLEVNLGLPGPGWARGVWLVSIDALLPSPFRAALIVARSALLARADASDDMVKVLRERLMARVEEGSLLAEPQSTLFLIA